MRNATRVGIPDGELMRNSARSKSLRDENLPRKQLSWKGCCGERKASAAGGFSGCHLGNCASCPIKKQHHLPSSLFTGEESSVVL